MAKALQRITPFLWFDDKAEEAATFYASIFEDSRLGRVARYDEESARAASPITRIPSDSSRLRSP